MLYNTTGPQPQIGLKTLMYSSLTCNNLRQGGYVMPAVCIMFVCLSVSNFTFSILYLHENFTPQCEFLTESESGLWVRSGFALAEVCNLRVLLFSTLTTGHPSPDPSTAPSRTFCKEKNPEYTEIKNNRKGLYAIIQVYRLLTYLEMLATKRRYSSAERFYISTTILLCLGDHRPLVNGYGFVLG